MERIKLSEKMLVASINSGMTRPQIAEQVGLSVGQLNQALKMKGLEKMRAKTVKFEFVEEDEATEEVVEETANMPEIPMEFPTTFGTPTTNAMPLGRDFE